MKFLDGNVYSRVCPSFCLQGDSVWPLLPSDVRNEVAKVMFLHLCVCPRGVAWSRGVPGPNGDLLLGGAWSGGFCSQGVPGPGGALDGGSAPGRWYPSMHWGRPPRQMATIADGTHPTGMHSCPGYLGPHQTSIPPPVHGTPLYRDQAASISAPQPCPSPHMHGTSPNKTGDLYKLDHLKILPKLVLTSGGALLKHVRLASHQHWSDLNVFLLSV